MFIRDRSGDYQILQDYLRDNRGDDGFDSRTFATFVDGSVSFYDKTTEKNVDTFDPRINEAPYELGFVDADGNKLARFNVLAVVGNRVILAESWPQGEAYDAIEAHGEYYYRPVNRNERVDESEQVDVLNFNNTGSPVDEVGVLTSDTIVGFGMGDDIQLEGIDIPGGIRYSSFEELNMSLGGGNDSLTIEATHTGVTNINSGIGDDVIDVKTISGHTTINLETDSAGSNTNDVVISSDDGLADQIMALLTISGDESADNRLKVNDSSDQNNNTMWLTENTITGLDMPSVPEQFILTIQAEAGLYTLSIEDNLVPQTLSWNASLAEVTTAISTLYDLSEADVEVEFFEGVENDPIKKYQVTFKGDAAGIDLSLIHI